MLSDWDHTTWGEVVELRYGKALRDYRGGGGGVAVFGTNGPVGFTDTPQAKGPGVIVGRKGAYRGVHFSARDYWVIDTAFYLAPKRPLDMRWAYYSLQLADINGLDSGSAIPSTTRESFSGLRAYIPPLPEQQAIAEVLGALDDKIAANTALAATAEQVLRAEIDAVWFRSDDRNSTLSDFVELNPKVTMPRTDAALYVDMKRLPESGWSIDGLDYREPKGGARFENGDTLLARITPCLENRKTGFVDHLPEGRAAVGSTEFIVLRARSGVAPPISFLLATAPRFRDHAIQHMIGTSGRQRVAASDLASFELPNPDPDWLADFGSRAVAVFDLVASQAAESRTLAAMRDALLPQLMSGKLRVRDAEDLIVQAGV